MKIIYTHEPIPSKRSLKIGHSLFLAGPTPRQDTKVPSWRTVVVDLIRAQRNNIITEVLIPEPRDGIWKDDYNGQIDWEEKAIGYADILAFWVPRDIKNGMPGFTTNVEFGWWLDKKEKIVFGYPPEADKVKYLEYKFKKQRPNDEVVHSVYELVKAILSYQ